MSTSAYTLRSKADQFPLTFLFAESVAPAGEQPAQLLDGDVARAACVLLLKGLHDVAGHPLPLRVLVHHLQKVGERQLTACGGGQGDVTDCTTLISPDFFIVMNRAFNEWSFSASNLYHAPLVPPI